MPGSGSSLAPGMSIAAPTEAIGSGALLAVRAAAAYPPPNPATNTAMIAIVFILGPQTHYPTTNRAAALQAWLSHATDSDCCDRRGFLPRHDCDLCAVELLPRRTLSHFPRLAGRRHDAHRVRRLRAAAADLAGARRPDVQLSIFPRLGHALHAARGALQSAGVGGNVRAPG